MAWFKRPRWVRDNVHVVQALNAAAESPTFAAQTYDVNTSAVRGARNQLIGTNQSWQVELWARYDDCGEFGLAVNWRANMMSRVRLRAARFTADADEPTIVDVGLAADLVRELFGGVGGQSDAMAALSTFLDVPGEGWVVGERRAGRQTWRTCSRDEIRTRGATYEVMSELSVPGREVWRELSSDALVVRVWRPHPRVRHEPYSPARAALGAMHELDLVNRHIQAQYLSRLASAGLIVLPEELTFPTRREFDDAVDPFVAEWIATAKEAIATPGTAAAVVPIPMRVPAEYVDKVKHIDFTLKLDEKIIEKRDAARRRLAGIVNVPTELLFDAGSINHWGLWQLEESGVKTYVTPDVELIVGALTLGYLHPRLRAANADVDGWVVWYDTSEIVTRPDMSDNTIKAYDRLEVSGKALRREIGLDEADAPSEEELREIVLKKLATNSQVGFDALRVLTGEDLLSVVVPTESSAATGIDESSVGIDGEDDREPQPSANGTPSTRESGPRTPRGAADAEWAAFKTLQAGSQHVLEFTPHGHTLKHPLLCAPQLFSCPFAHAVRRGVLAHPGRSGDYACTLSLDGELLVGQRVFPSSDALISDPPRGVNGVAVRS